MDCAGRTLKWHCKETRLAGRLQREDNLVPSRVGVAVRLVALDYLPEHLALG